MGTKGERKMARDHWSISLFGAGKLFLRCPEQTAFPEGYFPEQMFDKPIPSDLYRKGPCYASVVYQKVSRCIIILQGLRFLKLDLVTMNLWAVQAVNSPHRTRIPYPWPRNSVLQLQSLLLQAVDYEGGLHLGFQSVILLISPQLSNIPSATTMDPVSASIPSPAWWSTPSEIPSQNKFFSSFPSITYSVTVKRTITKKERIYNNTKCFMLKSIDYWHVILTQKKEIMKYQGGKDRGREARRSLWV